jgi:hypothetical protein
MMQSEFDKMFEKVRGHGSSGNSQQHSCMIAPSRVMASSFSQLCAFNPRCPHLHGS